MPKGDNAGRKPGSFERGAPKTKKLELALAQQDYNWVKAQPRGFLTKVIEAWASGELAVPEVPKKTKKPRHDAGA